MDGRHLRKERSRNKIIQALTRLREGRGTHPQHAGLRVLITKEAVAREAGVSPATLYRFEDLVNLIGEAIEQSPIQQKSSAQQRRDAIAKQLAELQRQRDALLAENLRLTRILKTNNINPDKTPVDLESARKKRRS